MQFLYYWVPVSSGCFIAVNIPFPVYVCHQPSVIPRINYGLPCYWVFCKPVVMLGIEIWSLYDTSTRFYSRCSLMLLNTIPVFFTALITHDLWLMERSRDVCWIAFILFRFNVRELTATTSATVTAKVNIRPYFVHNIELSQAACCAVLVKFDYKQVVCPLCYFSRACSFTLFFFTCCQPLIQNLMFTGVFVNGKVL